MFTQPLVFALGLVVALASTGYAKTPADKLEAAYKKEFSFLEAERAALKKRLSALKAQSKKQQTGRRVTLTALQKKVVGFTTQNDLLTEEVTRLEREVDSVGNSADVLEGLMMQIDRALQSEGIKWSPKKTAQSEATSTQQKNTAGLAAEKSKGSEQAGTATLNETLSQNVAGVGDGLERAIQAIQANGTVRQEAGSFFLADGVQVKGDIFHFGRIAVFGVSGENAGALTPAGQGRFKLDPVQGEATARALKVGSHPTNLGIFLFESRDKNYEPKKEKTAEEIIQSGGVIAWVIIGVGLFGLLLALLRALILGFSRTSVRRVFDEIRPLVDAKRYEELREYLSKKRGAGYRVLKAVATGLEHQSDDIERVLYERMLVEEGRLDRFGTMIVVIAAVAPLLGLLGTVTGMISTFDVITEFGTGNPKLLSGGISEALVTTELGLIVAIPLLLLGNVLNGWALRCKTTLEYNGIKLANLASGLDSDIENKRREMKSRVLEPNFLDKTPHKQELAS